MRTRSKNYVLSEQLKCSGTIGRFFQLSRTTFVYFALLSRDVFFDGNERIVEKIDSRNPSAPPRKVRVV